MQSQNLFIKDSRESFKDVKKNMEDINQEVNKEATNTTTDPVKIEIPELTSGEPLQLEQVLKITKALSNLFESTNTRPDTKTLTYENIVIVDPAHVCMIKALNKEANLILSTFYNPDSQPKTPKLEYSKFKIVNGSLIAFDYLQKVMDVFKAFNGKRKYNSEAIRFIVGEDYPLTISNDYFLFLVAPRIESE